METSGEEEVERREEAPYEPTVLHAEACEGSTVVVGESIEDTVCTETSTVSQVTQKEDTTDKPAKSVRLSPDAPAEKKEEVVNAEAPASLESSNFPPWNGKFTKFNISPNFKTITPKKGVDPFADFYCFNSSHCKLDGDVSLMAHLLRNSLNARTGQKFFKLTSKLFEGEKRARKCQLCLVEPKGKSPLEFVVHLTSDEHVTNMKQKGISYFEMSYIFWKEVIQYSRDSRERYTTEEAANDSSNFVRSEKFRLLMFKNYQVAAIEGVDPFSMLNPVGEKLKKVVSNYESDDANRAIAAQVKESFDSRGREKFAKCTQDLFMRITYCASCNIKLLDVNGFFSHITCLRHLKPMKTNKWAFDLDSINFWLELFDYSRIADEGQKSEKIAEDGEEMQSSREEEVMRDMQHGTQKQLRLPLTDEHAIFRYEDKEGRMHECSTQEMMNFYRNGFWCSDNKFFIVEHGVKVESRLYFTLEDLIRHNGRAMPFIFCNESYTETMEQTEEMMNAEKDLSILKERKATLMNALDAVQSRFQSSTAEFVRLSSSAFPINEETEEQSVVELPPLSETPPPSFVPLSMETPSTSPPTMESSSTVSPTVPSTPTVSAEEASQSVQYTSEVDAPFGEEIQSSVDACENTNDESSVSIWYRVSAEGEKKGPYTLDQVLQWYENHQIPVAAQFSFDDGANWRSIVELMRVNGPSQPFLDFDATEIAKRGCRSVEKLKKKLSSMEVEVSDLEEVVGICVKELEEQEALVDAMKRRQKLLTSPCTPYAYCEFQSLEEFSVKKGVFSRDEIMQHQHNFNYFRPSFFCPSVFEQVASTGATLLHTAKRVCNNSLPAAPQPSEWRRRWQKREMRNNSSQPSEKTVELNISSKMEESPSVPSRITVPPGVDPFAILKVLPHDYKGSRVIGAESVAEKMGELHENFNKCDKKMLVARTQWLFNKHGIVLCELCGKVMSSSAAMIDHICSKQHYWAVESICTHALQFLLDAVACCTGQQPAADAADAAVAPISNAPSAANNVLDDNAVEAAPNSSLEHQLRGRVTVPEVDKSSGKNNEKMRSNEPQRDYRLPRLPGRMTMQGASSKLWLRDICNSQLAASLESHGMENEKKNISEGENRMSRLRGRVTFESQDRNSDETRSRETDRTQLSRLRSRVTFESHEAEKEKRSSEGKKEFQLSRIRGRVTVEGSSSERWPRDLWDSQLPKSSRVEHNHTTREDRQNRIRPF